MEIKSNKSLYDINQASNSSVNCIKETSVPLKESSLFKKINIIDSEINIIPNNFIDNYEILPLDINKTNQNENTFNEESFRTANVNMNNNSNYNSEFDKNQTVWSTNTETTEKVITSSKFVKNLDIDDYKDRENISENFEKDTSNQTIEETKVEEIHNEANKAEELEIELEHNNMIKHEKEELCENNEHTSLENSAKIEENLKLDIAEKSDTSKIQKKKKTVKKSVPKKENNIVFIRPNSSSTRPMTVTNVNSNNQDKLKQTNKKIIKK